MFHLERLLPRPPNPHDGPFLLDVVYRNTAVRYRVDDTHGAQAYSNCSEHLGAFYLNSTTSKLRMLEFLLALVKGLVSVAQPDLDAV